MLLLNHYPYLKVHALAGNFGRAKMYFGPHRYGKRLGFSRGLGVNIPKY